MRHPHVVHEKIAQAGIGVWALNHVCFYNLPGRRRKGTAPEFMAINKEPRLG
jgi:hypothetical protein